MKKINHLLLLPLFLAWLFTGCTTDSEPIPQAATYDNGVLIVNEGNFLSGDGEISHYEPETEVVTNNLYQSANGVVLAGYVEQIRVSGDNVYIVDSNQGGAKVVVVDKATFNEKGRVENLEIPRDAAISGNKLFIADWGNYDEDGNYTNPNSFIAVANINGGPITDKIKVPSRPESILAVDGNIFVVCETGREIVKIDPSSLQVVASKIYNALPRQLMESNGKMMLYSTLGQQLHLDEIDPSSLNTTKTVYDIPGVSRLILDGEGHGWALTSAYSADYSYTDNKVIKFSVSAGGASHTVFEAKNLKGIGLDKANSLLYIADDNGIQGNGTVILTDLQGKEIKKLDVGRVPSRFYFY